MKHADATETKITRRLVSEILGRGYTVSVYDGEEWPLKRSTDREAIFEALCSTDSDVVLVRNAAGERVGSILLIWGNGEDLISDHSDNAETNSIISAVDR